MLVSEQVQRLHVLAARHNVFAGRTSCEIVLEIQAVARSLTRAVLLLHPQPEGAGRETAQAA